MWQFINNRLCSAWINIIIGTASKVFKSKCVVLLGALDLFCRRWRHYEEKYCFFAHPRARFNNSGESTIIKSTALDWKGHVANSKSETASSMTSRGHSVVGQYSRRPLVARTASIADASPSLCLFILFWVTVLEFYFIRYKSSKSEQIV